VGERYRGGCAGLEGVAIMNEDRPIRMATRHPERHETVSEEIETHQNYANPGPGWIFCTNTDNVELSIIRAHREYNTDSRRFRFKVVNDACDEAGHKLHGLVSIWRKEDIDDFSIRK
jgi:hypothetical protein